MEEIIKSTKAFTKACKIIKDLRRQGYQIENIEFPRSPRGKFVLISIDKNGKPLSVYSINDKDLDIKTTYTLSFMYNKIR